VRHAWQKHGRGELKDCQPTQRYGRTSWRTSIGCRGGARGGWLCHESLEAGVALLERRMRGRRGSSYRYAIVSWGGQCAVPGGGQGRQVEGYHGLRRTAGSAPYTWELPGPPLRRARIDGNQLFRRPSSNQHPPQKARKRRPYSIHDRQWPSKRITQKPDLSRTTHQTVKFAQDV